MGKIIRIGTRESQLAVWQATLVQDLLKKAGFTSELVYIKSEGDVDLKTPLYEMGVQGVFTRSLDAALINDRIDIAVHSMKDVPTQLPVGIIQAAVLKRGSHKDIFVPHPNLKDVNAIFGMGEMITQQVLITSSGNKSKQEHIKTTKVDTGPRIDAIIATSSIRRIAQWRRRYPNHKIENLRGNVNTRLRKLGESNWAGAVFAAAGLERIGLRPENSIELDWMLPAPAQGAIMVVCREKDDYTFDSCQTFNDEDTAVCTKIERDFLRTLLGGCSTPISALATIRNGEIYFKGNILSLDGKEIEEIQMSQWSKETKNLGVMAAQQLLSQGGAAIVEKFRNSGIITDDEV